MKVNILSYLKELSVVILGISIAFAINTWAENKSSKEKELNVLENIVSELEHNISYIESVINANETMLLQYDTVMNELSMNSSQSSNLSLRVVKLFLQDTGTEMAISIGILSQVEFNLAREISYCHKLQQNTISFETTFFDQLDIDGTDTTYYRKTKNKLSNYNVALINLVKTQKKLLLQINKYLESKFS